MKKKNTTNCKKRAREKCLICEVSKDKQKSEDSFFCDYQKEKFFFLRYTQTHIQFKINRDRPPQITDKIYRLRHHAI